VGRENVEITGMEGKTGEMTEGGKSTRAVREEEETRESGD
jgi:hypothetical protein